MIIETADHLIELPKRLIELLLDGHVCRSERIATLKNCQ